MGRFITFLVDRFRQWERPAQIGLALAFGLLVMTLLAAAFGPATLRQPSLIGAFGLLIAVQVIFMWANRHLVTPFTQAQRAYLAEDFDTTRRILESLDAADKSNARSLTLLGNTYRQLGLLDESQDALTKAVIFDPSDPFPLYGFGRTLLVKGLYVEAADALVRAVAAGAPPVVHTDLGETLYRQGKNEEARTTLESNKGTTQEPHRVLMAGYLLYRMGAGQPPSQELLRAGLPFWLASARRFQHTPYGRALADDVRHMQQLMEE